MIDAFKEKLGELFTVEAKTDIVASFELAFSQVASIVDSNSWPEAMLKLPVTSIGMYDDALQALYALSFQDHRRELRAVVSPCTNKAAYLITLLRKR